MLCFVVVDVVDVVGVGEYRGFRPQQSKQKLSLRATPVTRI